MHTSVVIFFAATIGTGEPKPGDVGTAEYKKAVELVQQLGHAQFAVRERAAKQLVEMEQAAVPALNEGAKSGDAEIKARSTALIAQAKAALWKRRATAYRADIESKQSHDLPLLAEWDKLIGKPDNGSRELFAVMAESNGEFLARVAADRKNAKSISADQYRVVFAKVQAPKVQIKAELGDLAAILFVDALAPIGPVGRAKDSPAELLKNPALHDMLDAKESGPGLRRLIVCWAETQPSNNEVANIQFADLVRMKPFPEAVPELVKLAKNRAPRWLIPALLAIQALGAVGGKEAEAALGELIADTSIFFRGDEWKNTQLGDSALAALLTMHRKKHAEFGLSVVKMNFQPPVGIEEIPMAVYGFPSADARTKAIKKWKDEVESANKRN